MPSQLAPGMNLDEGIQKKVKKYRTTWKRYRDFVAHPSIGILNNSDHY